MASKHPSPDLKKSELLNSLEFILHLKFEITYANTIRGGHFPLYFGPRKRQALVHRSNQLTAVALKVLAAQFPIIHN
jgi:hypothetical protein